MTTLAVLQPGFLPWLGFFDQMLRSDIFVYYDDVQFDKHGWRNRNRVKGPAGPQFLTVPILHSGRTGQTIAQVEIDNRSPWARKQLRTIRQLYAKAPFLEPYASELEAMLQRPWERLLDLDLAVTALMCDWLGVTTSIRRASQLGASGGQSERLLSICRMHGATCYLSGDAARDYLDLDLFAQAGIRVQWQDYKHPVYAQRHGPFISHLSALDLVLNLGPDSGALLASQT
jgi:hypothetical protein